MIMLIWGTLELPGVDSSWARRKSSWVCEVFWEADAVWGGSSNSVDLDFFWEGVYVSESSARKRIGNALFGNLVLRLAVKNKMHESLDVAHGSECANYCYILWWLWF